MPFTQKRYKPAPLIDEREKWLAWHRRWHISQAYSVLPRDDPDDASHFRCYGGMVSVGNGFRPGPDAGGWGPGEGVPCIREYEAGKEA